MFIAFGGSLCYDYDISVCVHFIFISCDLSWLVGGLIIGCNVLFGNALVWFRDSLLVNFCWVFCRAGSCGGQSDAWAGHCQLCGVQYQVRAQCQGVAWLKQIHALLSCHNDNLNWLTWLSWFVLKWCDSLILICWLLSVVLYLTLSLRAVNKGKGRGGFGRKSGLTREVQESVSCLQKMPCEMNVLCVCDLLFADCFMVSSDSVVWKKSRGLWASRCFECCLEHSEQACSPCQVSWRLNAGLSCKGSKFESVVPLGGQCVRGLGWSNFACNDCRFNCLFFDLISFRNNGLKCSIEIVLACQQSPLPLKAANWNLNWHRGFAALPDIIGLQRWRCWCIWCSPCPGWRWLSCWTAWWRKGLWTTMWRQLAGSWGGKAICYLTEKNVDRVSCRVSGHGNL